MNVGLDTRVMQSPRTACRVVGGKAVVVLMDSQGLCTLSPVGTFVWERADGRTLGAIVDAVTAEFEVEPESAVRDVIAFVEQLARLRAIELSSPPGVT